MLQALGLNLLHTRDTAYWRSNPHSGDRNRPRIRQYLARTMTSAGRATKHRFKRPAAARSAALAVILAGLLAAAPGSIAHAGTSERVVADRHTGLALYGVDPVAFHTNKRPTEGREEFELRYAGVIWRFQNEGNRAAFIKDPAIYMPRYGGYDPLGIARGVATPGYPALWSVVDDRLYLFHTAEAQKLFLADPRAGAAAADARWPAVMQSLPE
jgi:hypothetical protein